MVGSLVDTEKTPKSTIMKFAHARVWQSVTTEGSDENINSDLNLAKEENGRMKTVHNFRKQRKSKIETIPNIDNESS